MIQILKECVLQLSQIDDDKSPAILLDQCKWAPVNYNDEVVVQHGENIIFNCPGTTFSNKLVNSLSTDSSITLR